VKIRTIVSGTAMLELMARYDRWYWAVAWATTGFEAWECLLQRQHKIQRLIVGTFGRKTDPTVLHALRGHQGFRFVTNTRRVFHHKLFLFEDPKSDKGSVKIWIITEAMYDGNRASTCLLLPEDY
jgi:hypothetical protein